MSDRSTLAEALASFDRYEAIRQQERPGDGHPFMYQVVAAARRVLDATPIRWCEEHAATVPDEWTICDRNWRAYGECRIVDKLVIDGIGASNGE